MKYRQVIKVLIFFGAILFSSVPALAEVSAVVVTMKGEAHFGGEAKKAPLHVRDAVPTGATVVTGAMSFVRLAFPDNSIVNIGPSSEIKIQPMAAGNAPTLEVLTGKLRAKVTREVMEKVSAPEGGDLKMVVKTKSSAIGVRGTDFQVIYNREIDVTALVTFEGHVSMAKLERQASPVAAILSPAAVLVGPGQFSSTTPAAAAPSPPVKISPAQFNTLKQNSTMQGAPASAQAPTQASISPIPPGADPKALAASGTGLAAVMGASASAPAASAPAALNDKAPRAGGFLDLNSGVYVPPPAGSAYDANTGVFVPPANAGTINPATGSYQAPAGVILSASTGKFESVSNSAAPSALVVSLNQAVAAPASASSISLNTSFVAPAGSGLAPALTASLAENVAAPASVSAASSSSLDTTTQVTCITCHDTNVQATQSATKSAVGFQLTVQ